MIDAVLDLSHWQTSVDFAAVKAGGAEAVILKATQGSEWIDDRFLERVEEAGAVGLLVGAYHFADATAPAAQCSHFLAVAGDLDVLAVDLEPNSSTGGTVSVPQGAELAARVAMATRRAPLIYIGRYGPDQKGTGLPNRILMRCPLWIPHYTTAAQPSLPSGWSTWKFWQYTEKGPTEGVSEPCDRDRYNGTSDELRVWWSGAPVA